MPRTPKIAAAVRKAKETYSIYEGQKLPLPETSDLLNVSRVIYLGSTAWPSLKPVNRQLRQCELYGMPNRTLYRLVPCANCRNPIRICARSSLKHSHLNLVLRWPNPIRFTTGGESFSSKFNDYWIVRVDSTLYSRQRDADFAHPGIVKSRIPPGLSVGSFFPFNVPMTGSPQERDFLGKQSEPSLLSMLERKSPALCFLSAPATT